MSLVYIAILVIFFLWMRNNSKKTANKEKSMQDSIRPGMYIMLKDGLYGTVVDTEGDTLIVNFSVDGADEGCMTVYKTAVSTIVEGTGNLPGPAAAAEPEIMEIAEDDVPMDESLDDGSVEDWADEVPDHEEDKTGEEQ